MLGFPATFGHLAFAFNGHLNADGTPNGVNAKNTVTIDEVIRDPSFREGREPYHVANGGSLGRVHKGFLVYRLRGRILVPDATQLASLADKEDALRAAFDPFICYTDSPTTDGAYAFDHTRRTTDTTTYPTGRIPVRIYGRPMGQPSTADRVATQGVMPYALGLIVPDPRVYEQTEQTLALTIGSPSGNLVNRGSSPAPLKATIVMSGAGASNFTIARGGVSFVLDLSGMVNLDSIVVVFEPCGPYGKGKLITKNGTSAFSLKTSGPSTWLNVPVGTTAVSISNTTGITSCTLAWYSARV